MTSLLVNYLVIVTLAYLCARFVDGEVGGAWGEG